jgi:alpha-L-fucosidase
MHKPDEAAKPTKQQEIWQDLELGLFCHFGINTFNDKEWGDGTDDPDTFHPTSMDCLQWARTAKKAGFKYLILTAKHHDGFCLWPTKTTDYSVKSVTWRNGKGDVVRECAEACRQEGIHFGIYLSPWDRHEPCYENKAYYDQFYLEQLKELLTGYGPLIELWFDGAGSEGRQYDWKKICDTVTGYQPDAMIFNMGRPTIRWVGNEDGLAPETCRNTASEARASMFTEDMLTWLPDTPKWVPAECDVPIRKKHWFWHPDDEGSLLSLEELMDIYYKSVGRGTNLLLNVSPDRNGLFPEADAERLLEFGDEIRKRFSKPIKTVEGPGKSLELMLEEPAYMDHAIIMEEISEGERIKEYKLEAGQSGKWIELARGTSVGHKKINHFDRIMASRVRFTVLSCENQPLIRSFSVYHTGVEL